MVNTQQSTSSDPHAGPTYSNGGNKQSDRFFRWIRESGVQRLQDRWIGGVCSGIARTLGWSPTLVRALMAASVLLFGFGAALYAFAWLLLPDVEDGHIIVQDLIAGHWDWVFLGPVLCLVVALALPGVGVLTVASAGLALFILINITVHRGRMDAMAGDPTASSAGGFPSQPSAAKATAAPASSAASSASTRPPSPSSTSASFDQRSQSRPMPTQPDAPNVAGRPIGPQPEYAPYAYRVASDGNSGGNTMTVNRHYARRKPAGFAVVSLLLGAILLSLAWYLFGFSSHVEDLESLLKTALMWSAGGTALLGLAIIALGLIGRRSGGLIPLALLSVILTTAIFALAGGYAYLRDDMSRSNADYAKIVVSGERAFGSSEQDMSKYAKGMAFTGTGIDSGEAHIDLSGYAEGRKPHDLKLTDGSTVRSTCPVGNLTMTVYNAKVLITLPRGCSFAFVSDHGQLSMRGLPSLGGPYTAIRFLNDWIGLDPFGRGRPYLTEREYNVHGEAQTAMDPELSINATHVLQGRIDVEYSDPVTVQGQSSQQHNESETAR